MKRSEIIDYIKAYAAKFVFGSLASYETIPTTDDLVNEDIPSWQNVNEIIGTTIPPGIPVEIAATTVDNPVSTPYIISGSDLDPYQAFNPEPKLFAYVVPEENKRMTVNDITAEFTRDPDSSLLTEIKVYLHDNGEGENADTTLLVFY